MKGVGGRGFPRTLETVFNNWFVGGLEQFFYAHQKYSNCRYCRIHIYAVIEFRVTNNVLLMRFGE